MRTFYFWIWIVYIFLPVMSFAQKNKNLDKLIPYRITDNWGFADIKGNLKIPAQFEEVDFFQQDLAKVKQKGLWGLIDKNGKIFLPCAYHIVYGAGKSSRVVVCKGGDKSGHKGLWGFLPTYIPNQSEFNLAYELIRECDGNGLLGVMKNGRWGAIDGTGKLRIPTEFELGYTHQHTLHTESQITTTLPTEENERNLYLKLRFINHLARVSKNKKWGFFNDAGNEVIKVQYDFVGDFSEDAVAVIGQTNAGLKLGFLNVFGDTIVSLVYDVRDGVYQKTAFKENVALVGRQGKLGYVGKDGKIKIDFLYAQAHHFSEGRAWVSYDYQSINPTWHMIDDEGKLIYTLPTDCQLLDYTFQEGFVRIRQAGKENFLNKKGELLLNAYLLHTEPFQNGLAMGVIVQNEKPQMGFLNSKGDWTIPAMYDYTPESQNFQRVGQFIRLRQAGKYGVLNVKGRVIVPFAYEGIEMPLYLPQDDLFGVHKTLPAAQGGKWGYLNPQNKWLIKPQYEQARAFYEGFAKVRSAGKWGYINLKNKQFWQ